MWTKITKRRRKIEKSTCGEWQFFLANFTFEQQNTQWNTQLRRQVTNTYHHSHSQLNPLLATDNTEIFLDSIYTFLKSVEKEEIGFWGFKWNTFASVKNHICMLPNKKEEIRLWGFKWNTFVVAVDHKKKKQKHSKNVHVQVLWTRKPRWRLENAQRMWFQQLARNKEKDDQQGYVKNFPEGGQSWQQIPFDVQTIHEGGTHHERWTQNCWKCLLHCSQLPNLNQTSMTFHIWGRCHKWKTRIDDLVWHSFLDEKIIVREWMLPQFFLAITVKCDLNHLLDGEQLSLWGVVGPIPKCNCFEVKCICNSWSKQLQY